MNRNLNIVGLLSNLVGTLMLFYYGMPFHVPTGGRDYLFSSKIVSADNAIEHRYAFLGYVGLTLLIVGTLLQTVALFSFSKKSS